MKQFSSSVASLKFVEPCNDSLLSTVIDLFYGRSCAEMDRQRVNYGSQKIKDRGWCTRRNLGQVHRQPAQDYKTRKIEAAEGVRKVEGEKREPVKSEKFLRGEMFPQRAYCMIAVRSLTSSAVS